MWPPRRPPQTAAARNAPGCSCYCHYIFCRRRPNAATLIYSSLRWHWHQSTCGILTSRPASRLDDLLQQVVFVSRYHFYVITILLLYSCSRAEYIAITVHRFDNIPSAHSDIHSLAFAIYNVDTVKEYRLFIIITYYKHYARN